jgi:pimeloyl-ACP methyl ester carboxylesterase
MIVFAHGMEGSPKGTKVRAMQAAGLELDAPDFQGQVLEERVSLLEEVTAGRSVVLAGSSYGGLAAAVVAQRHPERFSALCLLAPALGLKEAPAGEMELRAPAGLRTVIIHGTEDPVCDIADSRAYRDRSGDHVELLEVADGHRLEQSIELVVETLRRLNA